MFLSCLELRILFLFLSRIPKGSGSAKYLDQPPHAPDHRIDFYRPRIEGLFARIERWTNVIDAKDISWRSISKDNITSWYGKTSKAELLTLKIPHTSLAG
jgi:hypothetical protein